MAFIKEMKKLQITGHRGSFRMAAWTLGHSKCYLGAFYRKVSSRKGSLTAIKATARKVAFIFWNMMCRKTGYEVHSPVEYEARYQRAQVRKLEKQPQVGYGMT